MEGLVDSFVMGAGGVEVVLVWQLIGAFVGAKIWILSKNHGLTWEQNYTAWESNLVAKGGGDLPKHTPVPLLRSKVQEHIDGVLEETKTLVLKVSPKNTQHQKVLKLIAKGGSPRRGLGVIHPFRTGEKDTPGTYRVFQKVPPNSNFSAKIKELAKPSESSRCPESTKR
jgi:hypothetical protein